MKPKPLFSARVIEKALQGSALEVPAEHLAIIQNWQAKTEFKSSETNLDGSFITGFLCPLLGYEEANKTGEWTIQKNTAIPGGGNVDVGIGRFDQKGKAEIVAPFELKGPKTKDLDALMPGRAKTPVQQAWEYATFIKGAQWVLVSNMVETRLYAVGYGRQAYETFQLNELHKPVEYARFRLLLGAPGLLEGGTAELLARSEAADKDITNKLYKEYKQLRQELVTAIRAQDAALPVTEAIQYAQTILDRVLFIAFAEDTYLLPKGTLNEAFTAENPYVPTTAWQRLTGLFKAVDKGLPGRKIPPYNGGLFQENAAIDGLAVSEALCAKLVGLSSYDFASEVSVNILGHIFEQSITDIEAEKAKATGEAFDERQGKRKKDGVYYTPDFITRYIVEQTIGGWLEDRRRALGYYALPAFDPAKDYPEIQKAKGGGIKVSKLTPAAQAHLAYWQAYAKALAAVRVLDPACGSGAFLVQAFDYLSEESRRAVKEIQELQGGQGELLTHVPSRLLDNLYGVDLNAESVEITKLSLWLKTASREEKLRNLDDHIRQGNSVIADAAVDAAAFDWQAQFPAIMAAGGFDVVLGNPPYVRMEVLKPVKPYLEKTFTTATDRADLFVYFYEQGLRLLKPQGWLGYISSSTFMKTGSGSKLRALLASQATVQRVVDFGDKQVFEGATTYPVIMVMTKDTPPAAHAIPFTIVTDNKVDFGTLESPAPTYPQASLGAGSWQLEGDARAAVRRKIIGSHPTLKEVYGAPLYGIKTGLNGAFVIDQATRDRLVKEDPKAAAIIKPFLEGKDLQKWHATPRQLHIIYIPRDQLDIEQYPSVKAHLLPFKAALEKRATVQKWFELQQAQLAYKPYIEAHKIVYPDLSQGPKFSFERTGSYFPNTAYFLRGDSYLLAILNSRVNWYFLGGISNAMRGGEWRLRLFSQYIESIPIPAATTAQKSALAALSEQCQAAAEARYKAERKVMRRIPDLSPSPASAKLTRKLEAWHELDFAAFAKEVEKTFKQPIPLKERDEWEDFLAEQRAIIEARSAEIAQLEADINQRIYNLFQLNDDDIQIIEGKAS